MEGGAARADPCGSHAYTEPARPQARELGSRCPLKGGGVTCHGPGCKPALSDAKGQADSVNIHPELASFLGNVE